MADMLWSLLKCLILVGITFNIACKLVVFHHVPCLSCKRQHEFSSIIKHLPMLHLIAETNKWSNIAPMQVGREGVCAEILNGHVYACGGYGLWHCVDSVECYNPAEDHWSMVTPLNTARRGAGAAVLNDKLYVIGGTDGNNILKSVECYDSVTDTWSLVASMNSCRHNVGVTVINGCIFAVGGFDGVAFLNTSEFYDPESDKWCAFTQV